MKNELKFLLSKNKIEQVIQKLLSLPEIVNDIDDLYDEVILLSADYEDYISDKIKGILDNEQIHVNRNKINLRLLQIINILPDSVETIEDTKVINKSAKIIELSINEDFHGFNAKLKEYLIGVISGLLKINRQDIIIRQLKRGSVKMYIELSSNKANELIKIFKLGIYTETLMGILKIQNIKIKGWSFLNSVLLKVIILSCSLTVLVIVGKLITPLNSSQQKVISDVLPTPASTNPASDTPILATPTSPTPASTTPTSTTPASTTPTSTTPTSTTPTSTTPTSTTPTSTTPTSTTPTSTTPTSTTPAPTTPTSTTLTSTNPTSTNPNNGSNSSSKQNILPDHELTLINFDQVPKGKISIYGFVESAENQSRLEKISVRIGETIKITNNYGRFDFSVSKKKLPPSIFIQGPGYKTLCIPLDNYVERIKSGENNMEIIARLQKQEIGKELLIPTSIFASATKLSIEKVTLPTTSAKRTNNLEICINLTPNDRIPAGAQTIDLQIIGPTGTTLEVREGIDQFTGKKYEYTFSHSFMNNQKTVQVCANYFAKKFIAGTYKINIMHRGQKIADTSIALEK